MHCAKDGMKKEIIILTHNGGDIANQLWNHISIAAYARERGYACENHSFFEHADEFPLLYPNDRLVRLVFFRTFSLMRRLSLGPITQHRILVRVWRRAYALYALYMKGRFSILDAGNDFNARGVYLLPPSAPATRALVRFERDSTTTLLCTGWLFRNPEGIRRHHTFLIELLKPQEDTSLRVASRLQPLRARFSHLVGVHIRQADYTYFKNGRFYLSPERMRTIMGEYLSRQKRASEDTCFILCSDGPLSEDDFTGLHTVLSLGDAVGDLYVLAGCDVIIGSDSTFGDLAAYLGDIPHIIAKNCAMDWAYYADVHAWFPNRYSYATSLNADRENIIS